MKKKTADDYFIEILTLACDEELGDQIRSDARDTLCPDDHSQETLFPYLIELHKKGYIDAKVVQGGALESPSLAVIMFPRITIAGREYLEQLKSKKPLAKIKAKGLELLWIVLTSAATAIATTLITLALAKKVSP